MATIRAVGTEVQGSTGAVAVGPIDAIGELLARKPNARIALVQGSFDWFHAGHLALVDSVARGKTKDARTGKAEPFDLVVVLPTHEYERKPYLRNSFERRLELVQAAVEDTSALRGRVVVSDAMARLPNRPAELLQELKGAYPGAHLAYCLGADSFNESANHQRWPGFDWVERHVPIVVVPRGGHTVERGERATAQLTGPTVTVSSTEIRRAIYDNDIERLVGRVPRATMQAIREEAVRREDGRRAGARLLGAHVPSEQSFAALRASRPSEAVDLLALVDERQLSESMREHLASLQQRINEGANERRMLQYAVSKNQLPKESGYSDKLVLDARSGTKLAGRFLYKPMVEETAAKAEFVSILANLVGVPTPLVLTHELDHERTTTTSRRGVSVRLIDDVLPAHPSQLEYDHALASPKVLEALLLTRWLNEVVGNLDCWGAQFLVPRAKKDRYREILNIDLDEAFAKLPKETLHDALTNHFGKPDVRLEDCVWRDRDYVFAQPVGEAREHYDSAYTMYGPLWRAYMQGKVGLDFAAVKEKLALVLELPPAALLNAMRKYLDTAGRGASGELAATVALPAVPGGRMAKTDFERLFVERVYASVAQFGAFLDRMQAARENPADPLHQHYANLAPPAY